MVRTVLVFAAIGALLGMVAVTLAYPRYKAWDNTPAAGKALCDCAEVTRQTAEGLIHAQLIGLGSGAGLGLLGGLGFGVSRRRKAAAKAQAEALK